MSAAYLMLLLPLDLLHHKNKAVKHQHIKAGTWISKHCRLHAHAQQQKHASHVCYWGNQAWVFMATIRQGLAAAMPLAQKAREQQQCRSQAMTPRLSG
jgi:GrpB-like predicted nucleotidyltransferase (UPF0157 family)